jgi:hypothetical protein
MDQTKSARPGLIDEALLDIGFFSVGLDRRLFLEGKGKRLVFESALNYKRAPFKNRSSYLKNFTR